MKYITTFLLIAILLGCNSSIPQKEQILGIANRLEEGTNIYLIDKLAEITIDSSSVENGKLEFDVELGKTPKQFRLQTQEIRNGINFWVDSSMTIITLINGEFRNSSITGSKTENSYQNLLKSKKDKSPKEREQKDQEFVFKNPDNMVSALLLSFYSSRWGKEMTSEMYADFTEELKASGYGKKINKYLELNKNLQIGDQFADLSMTDSLGNKVSMSDYKGSTILLEYWASWCGPCRSENPELLKTYNKFKSSGFEIYAVSLDEVREDWLKAIKEDKINWTHVSDLKGKISDACITYGIDGLPDNFLIDKEGRIVGRNLRGKDLINALISLKLEPLDNKAS